METKICVLGLGYVGLPLAVELKKHYPVIGIDIDDRKIRLLKDNKDPSKEIRDRKSTRLNSSHSAKSRMPSSA